MNKFKLLVSSIIVFCGIGYSGCGYSGNLYDTSKHVTNIIAVNCDKGRSVARAIRKARTGQTILVKGVCKEQIHITRDHITIIGKGHAGFDGSNLDPANFEFNPMIRVSDAVGVTIKNLFVRNGPAEGVIVEGKASVKLENVSAHDNSNVGMLVDHGRIEVSGGAYEANQAGIDTTNGASSVFRGDISLQNNGVFGIAASNGATIEARGAIINASNNLLVGVLLEGGSLSIFNFHESQGSQILADKNGACGFVLVGGGYLDVVAPPPLQFTGVNLLRANNNQGCGILLTSGSSIESPFGAASFQIESNPAGMLVTGNSDILINGGLSITNNIGSGLIGDGAGLIALAPSGGIFPTPDFPSVIQNNGGSDVSLSFGSRAIFESNVTVGSIYCDGTSLARGSAVCP